MKVTFVRRNDRIDGLTIREDAPSREVLAAPTVRVQQSISEHHEIQLESDYIGEQWLSTPVGGISRESVAYDRQFFALYFDPQSKQLLLPLSENVDPSIEGDSENPDVEMRIELEALHLPGAGVQSGTVRIQVSQDGKFLEGRDTLHWIVAAGLDLYKKSKDGEQSKPLKPGELQADLTRPFAGRAISLPGGAGYLRIDVLQDRKLSIVENVWKSIVSLFKSPEGLALAATVGFPAIGLPAVAFIDQLIDRVRADGDTDAVIEGKEMRWAFNKTALEKLKLGAGDLVDFPVMNRGFYVFVPTGQLNKIMSSKPRYHAGYGYLVPGDSVPAGDQAALARYLDDAAGGNYPYKDIPYAVLAVDVRKANVYKAW